jgi:hypothetical protein
MSNENALSLIVKPERVKGAPKPVLPDPTSALPGDPTSPRAGDSCGLRRAIDGRRLCCAKLFALACAGCQRGSCFRPVDAGRGFFFDVAACVRA